MGLPRCAATDIGASPLPIAIREDGPHTPARPNAARYAAMRSAASPARPPGRAARTPARAQVVRIGAAAAARLARPNLDSFWRTANASRASSEEWIVGAAALAVNDGAHRRCTIPPHATPRTTATNDSNSRAGSTRASRRGGECARFRPCDAPVARFRTRRPSGPASRRARAAARRSSVPPARAPPATHRVNSRAGDSARRRSASTRRPCTFTKTYTPNPIARFRTRRPSGPASRRARAAVRRRSLPHPHAPRYSQSELPRGRLGASRRSASTRRPCTFTKTCAPNPFGGRRVEPRRTSRPDCEPASCPSPRPNVARVPPPGAPAPAATNGSNSRAGSTRARRRGGRGGARGAAPCDEQPAANSRHSGPRVLPRLLPAAALTFFSVFLKTDRKKPD